MALSRHTIKTISMPLAMVVGALLCRPLAALEVASGNMLTPSLIGAMLFLTFCRVDVRKMRPQWIHLWMLLFQFVGSVAVYHLVEPLLGEVVGQGALICVLAPIAMAAVVIGGMLGANVTTMATYSLICNLITAVVAPTILHAYGTGSCTFSEIIARVAPTLIAPFVLGQMCRYLWRRGAEWFEQHSQLSFYFWLFSLILVIGRTTCFILDTEADPFIEVELAIVALVICLVQFTVGRALGRMAGDVVAGGQSLGQKNTVLAVWMALNFLDPVSSVAPTAYIVWQNIVNSYQIYRKK